MAIEPIWLATGGPRIDYDDGSGTTQLFLPLPSRTRPMRSVSEDISVIKNRRLVGQLRIVAGKNTRMRFRFGYEAGQLTDSEAKELIHALRQVKFDFWPRTTTGGDPPAANAQVQTYTVRVVSPIPSTRHLKKGVAFDIELEEVQPYIPPVQFSFGGAYLSPEAVPPSILPAVPTPYTPPEDTDTGSGGISGAEPDPCAVLEYRMFEDAFVNPSQVRDYIADRHGTIVGDIEFGTYGIEVNNAGSESYIETNPSLWGPNQNTFLFWFGKAPTTGADVDFDIIRVDWASGAWFSINIEGSSSGFTLSVNTNAGTVGSKLFKTFENAFGAIVFFADKTDVWTSGTRQWHVARPYIATAEFGSVYPAHWYDSGVTLSWGAGDPATVKVCRTLTGKYSGMQWFQWIWCNRRWDTVRPQFDRMREFVTQRSLGETTWRNWDEDTLRQPPSGSAIPRGTKILIAPTNLDPNDSAGSEEWFDISNGYQPFRVQDAMGYYHPSTNAGSGYPRMVLKQRGMALQGNPSTGSPDQARMEIMEGVRTDQFTILAYIGNPDHDTSDFRVEGRKRRWSIIEYGALQWLMRDTGSGFKMELYIDSADGSTTRNHISVDNVALGDIDITECSLVGIRVDLLFNRAEIFWITNGSAGLSTQSPTWSAGDFFFKNDYPDYGWLWYDFFHTSGVADAEEIYWQYALMAERWLLDREIVDMHNDTYPFLIDVHGVNPSDIYGWIDPSTV